MKHPLGKAEHKCERAFHRPRISRPRHDAIPQRFFGSMKV
jgi:hypothetical protein